MNGAISSPPGRRLHRGVLAVAVVFVGIGLVCLARPLSEWLLVLTPDGTLDASTQRFLDLLGRLVLLGGAATLVAAVNPDLRRTLAAPLDRSEVRGPRAGAWLMAPVGAAVVLRLVVARFGDSGLGDDGARVAWLLRWLENPQWITSSLWAPGHLYLHALFWLVVRNAVWAGSLLAALSSGGTTWILGHAADRTWGRTQGLAAATCVALLPTSVAYGATPDVNPVFAFLLVASAAAVMRFVRSGGIWPLAVAWLCLAFAEWSRFEGFMLVPGVAILLWPRVRLAVAFTTAALLPFLVWNLILRSGTGDALHVLHSVQSTYDPASLVTELFMVFVILWVAVTPAFLMLGLVGAWGALRRQQGREWLPVLLLHFGVLAGAAFTSGQGTQPRYLLLVGSILAAYSGVALAAMFRVSSKYAACVVGVVAIFLATASTLDPTQASPGDSWIRRSSRWREVVDRVASVAGDRDVVWVSSAAAYFYPCRIGIPIDRYHALSRPDSDVGGLLQALGSREAAVACVQATGFSESLWNRFLAQASGEWFVELLETDGDIRIYELRRIRSRF